MSKEITKLQALKSIALPEDLFHGIPVKVIETFKRRVKNERPSELRILMKRYLNSDMEHFPEDEKVPIEGVVPPSWEKSVFQTIKGKKRINRKMFELSALQQAKKGLKCREVWEKDAREYRNPDHDMPPEWNNDKTRAACYVSLKQPIEVKTFVDEERKRMTAALTDFNASLPENPHVKIKGRKRQEGRGQFAVDKLQPQEEPENLTHLKQVIKKRFGMIELLDVMAEADRLTDFTRYFTHSGTKEVRSRDSLRPLLILDLFAEATNHLILIKLLIYTGIRNAELTEVRLQDVDLDKCQIRIEQGKGNKDRYVLFPSSFKGELAQFIAGQKTAGASYLLESNRLSPYSTRRIRQIIKEYASAAGIEKRVYPHLFRHQIITFLTKNGIISPKLQLLSGHANERNLALYRDLALADVSDEYESAMKGFPLK